MGFNLVVHCAISNYSLTTQCNQFFLCYGGYFYCLNKRSDRSDCSCTLAACQAPLAKYVQCMEICADSYFISISCALSSSCYDLCPVSSRPLSLSDMCCLILGLQSRDHVTQALRYLPIHCSPNEQP